MVQRALAKARKKPATATAVGGLIRQWRERRRLSQLSLALDAEISARHLSFLETGRANPSREMVLLLARVLEVPPRGRNELLLAAGYAPVYHERGLDAPEMAQVRRALEFTLRQQEPYPALVVDGRWNILMSNEGSSRLMGLFLDPAEAAALGPPNAACRTRTSRQWRKAASVLPDPVGAVRSTSCPLAMTGHPCAWMGVDSTKRRVNHASTTGWNMVPV